LNLSDIAWKIHSVTTFGTVHLQQMINTEFVGMFIIVCEYLSPRKISRPYTEWR